MLSDQELQRYERQLTIPGWGESGQRKLNAARVAIAGAGGLGSSISTYLAAAGVGTIRIIDSDDVELSNLNRQSLYDEIDIGKAKTDSAKHRLQALNPDITIETFSQPITSETVVELVTDYLIVDALDNLETRLLLNRVSQQQ